MLYFLLGNHIETKYWHISLRFFFFFCRFFFLVHDVNQASPFDGMSALGATQYQQQQVGVEGLSASGISQGNVVYQGGSEVALGAQQVFVPQQNLQQGGTVFHGGQAPGQQMAMSMTMVIIL